MPDDKTPPAANGAAATDANVNINITAPEEDHPDSAVVPNPMSKIQVLEQDLVNAKLKIKHLEDEISSHESDKRALTSIASKTSELETQFSSLQHDLISSASEFEEKMREFQTGKARKIEVLLDKLKECEDGISELKAIKRQIADNLTEQEAIDRHIADMLSDLEPRERKIGDMLSEVKARERGMADQLSELKAINREIADHLSEVKAMKREIADKSSVQEAILRETAVKISELEAGLEAIEREKSDKISELEARLEATERDKSDKISELEARLEATDREKSDKISELEATEREKSDKIKLESGGINKDHEIEELDFKNMKVNEMEEKLNQLQKEIVSKENVVDSGACLLSSRQVLRRGNELLVCFN
ncbi:hypothetical protein Tco_0678190 [Tanacetum coccineum]|uniref:Uncharacterized protein n=1 Tax=Tanacetum coccineum TaxID=301880 RepID=A0ABQ4XEB6_9ASTR